MRTRRLWLGGASLLAVIAVASGYMAGRARAVGIPSTSPMNYGGVLTDASGTPLTGTRNIQIILWDDATAGTNQCSTIPATQTLAAGGAFQVVLPDACTAAVHAKADLWIELFVDGTSIGRAKLGAVPYAIEADHAVSATHATSADSAQGKFTIADSVPTDPNGLAAENTFLGHIASVSGWDATGMCATGSSGTDMCTGANASNWYWGYQASTTVMNTIMQLGPTGNLFIAGALSQASSAAFKKDIHFLGDGELDQVLRSVEATPVATFRYTNAASGSKVNYGVIAEKTPSLLLSDNGKGINLSNTIGALLASVKAQQGHITKLEARIRQLESRRGR